MDQSPVNKYWIKEGIAVRHKSWPELKMYVETINKQVKEVPEDNSKNDTIKMLKTFTINVTTHWITPEGIYQRGEFHTTELEPWNAGQNSKA